ncbi:MAG: hypothetical protein SFX18_00400 [Pirellulales bacterium]|nr:hypothetical protein [Pirellulales bacterium]
MDRQTKERELAELRKRVAALETDLGIDAGMEPWRTEGYYTAYHATSGFLLGSIPALVSLLFNVVGSYLWKLMGASDQHPLKLIQVYLTFPMGEKALTLGNELTLAIGCFLYIITGMFYGMIFQLFFSRFMPQATLLSRVLAGAVLGTVVWFVNFYLILSWLQPALLGGRWIVEMIPPWVALLTHLVFGITMALVSPWADFRPYVRITRQNAA